MSTRTDHPGKRPIPTTLFVLSLGVWTRIERYWTRLPPVSIPPYSLLFLSFLSRVGSYTSQITLQLLLETNVDTTSTRRWDLSPSTVTGVSPGFSIVPVPVRSSRPSTYLGVSPRTQGFRGDTGGRTRPGPCTGRLQTKTHWRSEDQFQNGIEDGLSPTPRPS